MENRRNTIVINKKFQYQYSLLIAAGAVLLVNGFLIMQMLFPGDMPLRLPTNGAIVIGAIELVLIVAIWFASLRSSHRIAGPVHVFTREVGKLGRGDLTCEIALRDTDMFKLEGESMNASIDKLRERLRHAKSLAGQIQQARDNGIYPQDHLQELCDVLAEFTFDPEPARGDSASG